MILPSLKRYYNLQAKQWYEDNVKLFFPIYLLLMGVMVVSIMICHVNKEESTKKMECNEKYYVVGNSVYYSKNDIHNGIKCYVVSKDMVNPSDKKSVYKYGLIPVDSVSGTYQKGDTIHLKYTNDSIQSLIDRNIEINILNVCYFIIVIGIASYAIINIFEKIYGR